MARAIEGKMVDGKFRSRSVTRLDSSVFRAAWYKYYNEFLGKYGLEREECAEQARKTDAIFNQYVNSFVSVPLNSVMRSAH